MGLMLRSLQSITPDDVSDDTGGEELSLNSSVSLAVV